MIEEAYCSYEVSKLLNEKGFRIDTEKDYWKIGADGVMYFMCSIGAYTSDPDNKYAFYRPKDSYPCPTQQCAMRWLREEHNLYIQVEFDTQDFFIADIYDMVKVDDYGRPYHYSPTIANCKTYEVAVEAAVRYVLENLL